jgi:hypothetical protein
LTLFPYTTLSRSILFIIKTGTMVALVDADRTSGDVHRLPIGSEALGRARRFKLERLLNTSLHFAPRAIRLALWLGAAYTAIGLAYLGAVTFGLTTAGTLWMPAWPMLVLLATTAGVAAIALFNLGYDLLRVIVVTDDCEVRTAVDRLCRFVIEDARQVIAIFCVMGGIRLLAVFASLLATAGLAIVAYVPLVSVVFAPLQAAAWVLRGLFFESLALCALAAYQAQYRRFSEARWPVPSRIVRVERPAAPAIAPQA